AAAGAPPPAHRRPTRLHASQHGTPGVSPPAGPMEGLNADQAAARSKSVTSTSSPHRLTSRVELTPTTHDACAHPVALHFAARHLAARLADGWRQRAPAPPSPYRRTPAAPPVPPGREPGLDGGAPVL